MSTMSSSGDHGTLVVPATAVRGEKAGCTPLGGDDGAASAITACSLRQRARAAGDIGPAAPVGSLTSSGARAAAAAAAKPRAADDAVGAPTPLRGVTGAEPGRGEASGEAAGALRVSALCLRSRTARWRIS